MTGAGEPALWRGLPVVSAARMRELDFDATARFGLPAAELMENAGRAVAERTLALLGGRTPGRPARIVAVCGRGANGGDGLVAARHLRARGAQAEAFVLPPKAGGAYPGLVRANLEAARAAGVAVVELGARSGLAAALARADAALDAVLGTGGAGAPAGAAHHAVAELARAKIPVIAVDLPSGLDADTGEPSRPCVRAALTLTLGLPKRGLLAARARAFVGELETLDIGYPAALVDEARAG